MALHIKAVSRLMGLTSDQIDGVMQRAVRRGLDRRGAMMPTGIGVDETSFQKRHEYVTVDTEHESGDVMHVADGRKRDSLDGFFEQLEPEDLLRIKLATSLARLKTLALQTARAWALKEHAMCLWHYVSRTWARKAWEGWISWAMRSRLEPMKKVARMVPAHLGGLINGIVLKATNAGAESVNSKIQKIERMACGFRNRDRFRAAIDFHLGGLDLAPATHTDS